MRILVVHQYYLAPGQPGGSRFNELARLWREAGHEVTVLAGTIDYATGTTQQGLSGRRLTHAVENDIHVWRCRVPESYGQSYGGRMWAFMGFTLTSTLAALKNHRPDVVIATSPPLTTAITGWIASIRHRAPWVFEIRDLWPESAVTTGVLRERSLLTRALYSLERFACRRANVVNVLTPAFADDIVQRGLATPDKIVFIPNGADLEAFEPSNKDNAVRARYGWSGRFVCVYAGAHGRANALMQLVDAATELRGDPDVLIACVGDGHERRACERAAADRGLDNIQFLGAQPKDAMPDFVNAADVGLAVLQNNPTFRTVYPNKVFDYMACERPIVLAIDGAARQLVCDDARAGIFAEPENGRAIAAAIRRFRDEPALAADSGRNGRRWVSANVDRRVLAARYLDVLSNMTGLPARTLASPAEAIPS